MKFITYYASNGTLDMPDEDKSRYRDWAYEELQQAFPDFTIEVIDEPNIKICDLYSDDRHMTSKSVEKFIERLVDRWQRVKDIEAY